MYNTYIKRLFDFSVALCAALVILPIILVISCFLFIVNSGKPFFFQKRPGKNGKIFSIVKFRTMTDERGASGELLPDEVRLTKIGTLVRKTSIDELPQLFNVIRGDMSIVGPRPLLPEYLELYSKEQSRRHDVKPGITGWAQVNGRNAITWEDKFIKDVWYVDNQSFLLDSEIIIKTIKKVIASDGVNREGEATTTRFKGSL